MPWRSPKEDSATATTSGGPAATGRPSPVGYLVNCKEGLAGVQGVGFDYVLGSGGLYVQSESAHLTARVLAAPCEVRGLAPVPEKVKLSERPHPGGPLRDGAALVPGRPGHREVLRRTLGRSVLPAGSAPTGRDCNVP